MAKGQRRVSGVRFAWGAGLASLAVGVVLMSCSPGHAAVESLARLVPSDVFAAYMVEVPAPPAGEDKSNTFDIATVLIDQAFRLGFLNSLDVAVRGWLDAIACVSMVIAHPHAVILFDIQAQREEDESHHVSNLRAAIVMRTGGNNRAMEHRIQHLLAVYTNQSESTLDTFQVDEQKVHRLLDRRLADWVVVCWANLGEYFVVALGEESLRQVVAALRPGSETLSNDPTFREGVKSLAAENSLITVLFRFDEIRKKSPHLGKKLTFVQAALGMPDCEQGMWAAGYAGRSLEIRQRLRCQGKSSVAVIAGAEYLAAPFEPLVPQAAQGYAVFGVEPEVWFQRIRRAYLASRSRKNSAESRMYWTQVESSAGLRFADFFSRLGSPIVVHDFPEHALRLPPAWTIVIPLQGASKPVRRDVDSLLSFWQKELEGQAWGLAKADDGIWFLKVGLEGPAVTVTERNLVFSFSPYAVRQNLERLRRDDLSKDNLDQSEPRP